MESLFGPAVYNHFQSLHISQNFQTAGAPLNSVLSSARLSCPFPFTTKLIIIRLSGFWRLLRSLCHAAAVTVASIIFQRGEKLLHVVIYIWWSLRQQENRPVAAVSTDTGSQVGAKNANEHDYTFTSCIIHPGEKEGSSVGLLNALIKESTGSIECLETENAPSRLKGLHNRLGTQSIADGFLRIPASRARGIRLINGQWSMDSGLLRVYLVRHFSVRDSVASLWPIRWFIKWIVAFRESAIFLLFMESLVMKGSWMVSPSLLQKGVSSLCQYVLLFFFFLCLSSSLLY